jgi:hypothetical protein
MTKAGSMQEWMKGRMDIENLRALALDNLRE